jgi:tetratricopeptide (TPR) repeat protein
MGVLQSVLAALGSTVFAACGGSTAASVGASAPHATEPGPSPASPPPESPASGEVRAGIKAFDAGDYAGARKSFENATAKDPGNYEAFHNLGLACEKLGDKPAAEAAYKAALSRKPELEAAATELCALYLDQGRIDDAIATGRAGLAKHPGSAALHENVGVALAAHGDEQSALLELESAAKLQPAEPLFRLTLAHWLNVWHVRGAIGHLDAAREIVKGDYAMMASIGYEYRMAGEFAACIETFDRAIAVKDAGEVRTERALCKLGLKDEKGALEDLQAGVLKDPGYAPAHYYLAGRLALGKRFKEAAAEYAAYLDLAPSGSLAKAARERMRAAQDAAKMGGPGRKK